MDFKSPQLFLIIIIIIIITSTITTIHSITECPNEELIRPCLCTKTPIDSKTRITCGGNDDLNLNSIFHSLSHGLNNNEKQFNELFLNNTSIHELSADTFKDITFQSIVISICENLSSIDLNAFTTTNFETKNIELTYNENLNFVNYSIFDILSKFVNLENLILYQNGLTQIPANAFRNINGVQRKLNNISITDYTIKKLGENCFANLVNLTKLELKQTQIMYFSENAFRCEEPVNGRKFKIEIETPCSNTYMLNMSSFAKESLANIGSTTQLTLRGGCKHNNIGYINETIFKEYLLSDDKNTIDWDAFYLDCDDCRNYWIAKSQSFSHRMNGLLCTNGKGFTDSSNFQDCDPINSAIKPCLFMDHTIYCTGNHDLNLNTIFQSLSNILLDNQKHFKRFYLNNTFITELKENTFNDIVFDEIEIRFCTNLTKIDKDTFTATNLVTTGLTLYANSKLTSTDNSIFEALSRFVNIREIFLQYNDFKEIPSNAFQPLEGYQNNLRYLNFHESFTSIGSRAFANLNNLVFIDFSCPRFKVIPDFTFAFNKPSNKTLTMDLSHCSGIDSSVFSEKSLLDINRPTLITIGSVDVPDQITYLDEKAFLPFLLENEKNTIDLIFESFNCNDCRNVWLKKYPEFVTRMRIDCSNYKPFNDPDNFKLCNTTQVEYS